MTARPFLKWVGSKRELVPDLEPHVPARIGRYHEPFLGGGSLFFHLRAANRFDSASLSDASPRLVQTYLGVRDRLTDVIRNLRGYEANHAAEGRSFYLDVRAAPPSDDAADVAAWFIYVNRAGFNGLYRENRRGRCNVPWGKRDRVTFDLDNLRAVSEALQGVEITVNDFGIVNRAEPGDFVYFDPPYVPISATSSFTAYTRDGFGIAEQFRLRDIAAALKSRGVATLLSNSAAPVVRDLYADGFVIDEVSARRAVNSNASKRGPVAELLIH